MEKSKCSYHNCTNNAKYEINWTIPTSNDENIIASHEYACNFVHAYLLTFEGSIYDCQCPLGTNYPVNRLHPDETPTKALVLRTGKRHQHLEEILKIAHLEGNRLYEKLYDQDLFKVAERGKMARY